MAMGSDDGYRNTILSEKETERRIESFADCCSVRNLVLTFQENLAEEIRKAEPSWGIREIENVFDPGEEGAFQNAVRGPSKKKWKGVFDRNWYGKRLNPLIPGMDLEACSRICFPWEDGDWYTEEGLDDPRTSHLWILGTILSRFRTAVDLAALSAWFDLTNEGSGSISEKTRRKMEVQTSAMQKGRADELKHFDFPEGQTLYLLELCQRSDAE